tara:strand:- start:255227 stop:256423 length:1197 start_codon:yes stop_codon:yes gene_type:complete
MKRSFIIHAKRTPVGKIGGTLSLARPDDMLAELMKDYLKNISFDPALVDDVIAGCANQAGEDNRNIARMAALLAGLPYEVPATTMNRLCGSSLDATIDAAARIGSGFAECIFVGGTESMTRAPLVISKGSAPFGRDSKMYDSTFGWRFPNSKMKEMFPLYGMGETAENVAEKLKISREDQDLFALESHQKAIKAQDSGAFDDEILPITIKMRKSETSVTKDECPRKETSLDILAKLKPVFREGGSVTAGNSSPMNDGAAFVVVVSEDFLKKHNLTPILEITGMGVRGIHPDIMGLGPVEAIKNLESKFSIKRKDFDVIELNEAFSAQALGCIRELDLDPSKINMNGGAIAIGHPLGCSGARILTTLFHIMKNDSTKKNGLASMCIGVGQGIALSVSRC